MAIDAQHPQYVEFIDKWTLIDDIIEQTNLDNYLIELNPSDTSDSNKARNEAYKQRALFYALTTQTITGMLGTTFSKMPELEAPESMMYLADNIDGAGNNIYQQSSLVVKKVLSISRSGLYVSFPRTDGEVSKADMNDGIAVATIQHVEAKDIINWDVTTIGAKTKLSLVVIQGSKTIIEDYVHKIIPTIRELFLENGIYGERIWEKPLDKWVVVDEYFPTDKTGNTFTEILFQFVGSVNNDANVDSPNMLAMAEVNVSHYRNSADFEDSVWYAGQAQAYMVGITQSHLDLMIENNMYVGSRELIGVPDGGKFGYESAPPNPLVRQAMVDKLEMMIGLGARMVTEGGVAKTAEQSGNERETQYSAMTLGVKNVSDAYEQAMQWVSLFMTGGEAEGLTFQLNTDFIKPDSSPAELKEMIMGFMAGSIPVSDYVRYMKDSGKFDEEKPNEDYEEELETVAMPDLGV